MTRKEKKQLMSYIFVTSVAGVNLFKEFNELSDAMIDVIDKYAEIFHIKPSEDGKSRAKVLWDIMQENLPF